MDISSIQNTTIREWYSLINRSQSVEVGAGSISQDTGDSVILSRSSSIETYLYTAQDILNALPAPPDAAESDVAQKTSQESPAAGANETQSLFSGNYRAAFLEIIKDRVQFLLEALVNAQDNGDTYSTAQTDLFPAEQSSGVADTTSLGYWSPEQTASRIVGFALAFYDGGDREEYAAMVRDAVMKGYYQALKAAGGTLPDIAARTISLVTDALDQFSSGNGVDVIA